MNPHYNAETNPTAFNADRAWLRHHIAVIRKEANEGVPSRLPELFTNEFEQWVVDGLKLGSSINIMAIHKRKDIEMLMKATRIQNLETELVQARSRIHELESENKNEVVEDLKKQLVHARDREVQLVNRITRLRAEPASSPSETSRAAWQERTQELRALLTQCESERSEAQTALVNMNERRLAAESSRAAASERVQELERRLQDMYPQRDAMMRECNSLRATIAELKEEQDRLHGVVRTTQSALADMNERRLTAEAHCAGVGNRVLKLDTENQALVAQYEQMDSDLRDTRSRAQRAEHALRLLEDKPTDAVRVQAVRTLLSNALVARNDYIRTEELQDTIALK